MNEKPTPPFTKHLVACALDIITDALAVAQMALPVDKPVSRACLAAARQIWLSVRHLAVTQEAVNLWEQSLQKIEDAQRAVNLLGNEIQADTVVGKQDGIP